MVIGQSSVVKRDLGAIVVIGQSSGVNKDLGAIVI